MGEEGTCCQAVQAENVTVLEGGTAQISCRLQNYDGSIVVIQNPRRQTLFFNGTRGYQSTPSIHLLLVRPLCQMLEPIVAHESKCLPTPGLEG
ncbi:Cell adhesion molecule 4 [Takifugu flavidus]|uniref:Cell adhesion molecule 4 n=1 Tax=Takifugu flavidus TaxID=433684 RepID=A0A5C6MJC0_9TELE|nr:Cell adhesion molecule 4 [Takifugu flavidus]